MNIYLRQVASEGINHHVEHCIFVPVSRVLFSSRCPTFRVSLLSSVGDHLHWKSAGSLPSVSQRVATTGTTDHWSSLNGWVSID